MFMDIVSTPIIVLVCVCLVIMYLSSGKSLGAYILLFNVLSLGLLAYFLKQGLGLYALATLVVLVSVNAVVKKIIALYEYERRDRYFW